MLPANTINYTKSKYSKVYLFNPAAVFVAIPIRIKLIGLKSRQKYQSYLFYKSARASVSLEICEVKFGSKT